MELTYPHYYPNFQCTASQCRDNCCIGWEIDIDPSTHARYMAQEGDFGRRLRGSISTDQPPHFLLRQERCPFLNDRNLCDIILTLGEGAICEICDQHPRFHEWFGNVKESGVGLCCEAAAKLILQDEEPASFLHAEIDEEPADFPDEDLFRAMLPARETLFAILQDRSRSIRARLGAALVFGSALQSCLEDESPAEEIRAFLEAQAVDTAIFFREAQSHLPSGGVEGGLSDLLSFLLTLEPIDEGWPHQLRALLEKLPGLLEAWPEFLRRFQPRAYKYEHLAVYFVYRYLLKAVYDGDALSKVKLAAASVLVISLLDTARWLESGAFTLDDQVLIAKNYSKEMEYCEENLLRFEEECWTADFLSAEGLLALLNGMT